MATMKIKKTSTSLLEGLRGATKTLNSAPKEEELRAIPLEDIIVKEQVRKYFGEDSIRNLRNSIESVGLMTPLLVTKSEDKEGKYVLLNGERRYRAVKSLEWETVNCIVTKRQYEKADRSAAQIADNLMREDLSLQELVAGVVELKDKHGMTLEAIGKVLGYGKPWIQQLYTVQSLSKSSQRLLKLSSSPTLLSAVVRLERKFPDEVKEFVDEAVKRRHVTREQVLKLRDELEKSTEVPLDEAMKQEEKQVEVQPEKPTVATSQTEQAPETVEDAPTNQYNKVIATGADRQDPPNENPQPSAPEVEATEQAHPHRVQRPKTKFSVTEILGFDSSSGLLHVKLSNGHELKVLAGSLFVETEV